MGRQLEELVRGTKEQAYKSFHAAFERLTGLDWEHRDGLPVAGKRYRFMAG
jgi:hypothetical protein